jgi:uncharacterized iron-regulated protein
MKKTSGSAILLVLLMILNGCRASLRSEPLRLYDVGSRRLLSGPEAVQALKSVRLIIVGEHHPDKWHHLAELEVIQALDRSGQRLAIGLEMFRRDSQAELNHWVAGETPERTFESIYLDNWNFDWALYRPIFEYARKKKIPMIGLNIPPSVSHQVAHQGFKSLTDEQKAGLSTISCDVTDQYREFIRKAYGAHHSGMQFENFCQAQLLWDKVMAKNALDYLKDHPKTTLVVLAGSGHARKSGIPTQVDRMSVMPLVVLLPETRDFIEPGNTTSADADYLVIPSRLPAGD